MYVYNIIELAYNEDVLESHLAPLELHVVSEINKESY